MRESVAIATPLQILMVKHARKEYPQEACGIITAKEGGEPHHFYPTRNELKSTSRYNIHPQDLLTVYNEMEKKGEHIWGIFHSHPQTAAYPSSLDRRLANFPTAYYIIVSLADQKNPELRAFRIINENVREIPIVEA